jgi:hypothetical protein
VCADMGSVPGVSYQVGIGKFALAQPSGLHNSAWPARANTARHSALSLRGSAAPVVVCYLLARGVVFCTIVVRSRVWAATIQQEK